MIYSAARQGIIMILYETVDDVKMFLPYHNHDDAERLVNVWIDASATPLSKSEIGSFFDSDHNSLHPSPTSDQSSQVRTTYVLSSNDK